MRNKIITLAIAAATLGPIGPVAATPATTPAPQVLTGCYLSVSRSYYPNTGHARCSGFNGTYPIHTQFAAKVRCKNWQGSSAVWVYGPWRNAAPGQVSSKRCPSWYPVVSFVVLRRR